MPSYELILKLRFIYKSQTRRGKLRLGLHQFKVVLLAICFLRSIFRLTVHLSVLTMIRIIFVLVLFSAIHFPAQVIAQEANDFQKAVQKYAALRPANGPGNINWYDNGNKYSFLEFDKEQNRNVIKSYSIKDKRTEIIFTGKELTFPESDKAFNYRSFLWAADGKHLVFESNFRPVYRRSGISDFYLYNIESQSLSVLAKDARTADLSPDGTKVGYERDGNLFVLNLSTGEEKQLTFDAEEFFYNGRFGWVYEEEFGLGQAWNWSHDSQYIAFWQQDERHVHQIQITDFSGQHNEWTRIPYPKVGDANPKTRIGVVDVNTGKLNWMQAGKEEDSYIPRIYWTAIPGTLALMHLNREQNHLKLFFFDVQSGERRLVMEESNDTWIDVFDFFAGIMHLAFFPEDRREFFWVSDRDGWQHIYRYDYEGKLLNQVTQGNWEVTYVHGFDTKSRSVFYTSTEVSPLERHFYSIRFDGKRKQRLTKETGQHHINLAPNAASFIDRYSNVNTPTQVHLKDSKGAVLQTLETNEGLAERASEMGVSRPELFTFTTSDGRKIDAMLMKPHDFDSTKNYPLVLDIYGGPGAQSVYNSWESSSFRHFLNQEGYVVASVNNRGSGGYGRDFEKMVYQGLGYWESYDFAEIGRLLGNFDWIDSERMAIRGHSYGGYMSSMTMARRPGVFKVGLVGAPVIDWRLYDSIYTERYMGLLPQAQTAYDSSSVTAYVDQLQDHLFVAHSAMDENVHLTNTMHLMTAAAGSGKDIDLRIYPPGAHGVAFNGASYYLLYQTYINYLNRHLKAN